MQDTLVQALTRYAITLPARSAETWRVATGHGTFPSLQLSGRLLATDGVVAYALLDDRRVFHCHLAAFEETKQQRTAGPRERKDKLLAASLMAD